MNENPSEEFENEAVEVPITREFDLHTFRVQEIVPAVEEYLFQAHEKGFLEVKIIHGKGIGVQRENVRKALARTSFVESYEDAPYGNRGATIAYLRPKNS